MNNTMPLSQAIRLGAMLKPQGFGVGDETRTCALQAALEAVGLRDGSCVLRCFSIWPEMSKVCGACPECGDNAAHNYIFYVASIHLNDVHRWTRERIADWVETVEREQEALTRRGEEASRLAHNQEIVGANPTAATISEEVPA